MVIYLAFECYPCKVLPPHEALVNEVNPVYNSCFMNNGNFYFCVFSIVISLLTNVVISMCVSSLINEWSVVWSVCGQSLVSVSSVCGQSVVSV